MVSVVLASAIAIGTLMVVTILVTLMTGSVFAAGVVVALIAIAYTVLVYYGFITVAVTGNLLDLRIWDVVKAPAPATATPTAAPLRGKEVYHVGDDRFTYDDAPAVCAAYGGDLATQDQVESAYSSGAEWCGYGWSAGGMALFPTQHATWNLLQMEVDVKKRTACGRPGVNGGYFDPALKFGVNCYGVKPAGSAILPQPPPGTDLKAFNDRVATFKSQLKNFFLAPFNRTTWAEASPTIAGYGSQFSQNIGGLAGSTTYTTPAPTAIDAGTSVGTPVLAATTVNASPAQQVAAPVAPAPPAYSGATIYRTGDTVSFGGSSYKMVEAAGSPGYAPDRVGDHLWQKV